MTKEGVGVMKMKRGFVFEKKWLKCMMLTAILIVGITGCSSKMDTTQEENVAETDNNSFVVATVESSATVEEKELSFEEANIFSFEMIKRDDESYDEIIAIFKVNNNSDKNIPYVSLDFNFTDANGNEICTDGRFHDCQVQAGKSFLIKSYSNLSGRDKAEIASINITSYKYSDENNWYEVNLQTQSVDQWKKDDESNVEFEKANILEFTLTDKGNNNIGSREVEVQIKNNGTIPVKYVSYRMAYFDENMNYLENDGRYSDSLINVGNFVLSKSYGKSISEIYSIGAFGIYSYQYELDEVDENGFNKYKVNLQTNIAEGQLVDK